MALHPTSCPLDCPDACGVLVETDERGELVRVRGNPAHPYSRGALCSKTSSYHELVESPERLRTPLVRSGGELVPVSWERAIERVAAELGDLRGEDVLAMQYAGSMGLVARTFPMRLMNALGATLHDSGVCDTTSSAGYEAVLGRLIGPDVLEAEEADGVVIWGSDVKRTIQHLFPLVKKAAAAGARVAVVDVWRTETLAAAQRWGGLGLVIRPGSDSILALALARLAFENGWADRRFLERECRGAADFEGHLRDAPTLAEAAQACGVPLESILDLAHVLVESQRLFLRTGSGWTRRTNGAMGMRALCSLAAVLGKAGRVHYESADVFPFDTDVIARPDLRPGIAPPTFTQVALGRELCEGRFGAVVVWGHNPALTLPDSARVAQGLSRQDLFVVVHEQFLTATAQLADVVLPATTFVEQTDLYRSYGSRVAQLGRRAVAPPEGPRSNVETFAAIARAMELEAATWDVSEESLVEELLTAAAEHLTPDQMERLRAGEPTTLDAPAGTRQSPGGTDWGTPSGKVELVSSIAERAGQPPMATWCADPGSDPSRSFWLVSAPSKHTHNTTYLDHERHARRAATPRCFVHPADAHELALAEGETVVLVNDFGRITLTASLTEDVPTGSVRVDGFPRPADVPEGTSINVLSSPDVSDLGNGTTYYSTRVDLERG